MAKSGDQDVHIHGCMGDLVSSGRFKVNVVHAIGLLLMFWVAIGQETVGHRIVQYGYSNALSYLSYPLCYQSVCRHFELLIYRLQ